MLSNRWKNKLRVLLLLGFSTLLIVSFQNCQGIDSATYNSEGLLDDGSNDGSNIDNGNTDGGGDDGGVVVVDPPVEDLPPPPPEPTACELGNIKPSWVTAKITNPVNGDTFQYFSEIDADGGMRADSAFELKVDAGDKGSPDDLGRDTLTNANCNLDKISGSGNLNANCQINGSNINVTITNGQNRECVEGEFVLRVMPQDSCGDRAPEMSFHISSRSLCLPQQVHQHANGVNITANHNFGYRMIKDGNQILVVSPSYDGKHANGGAAFIYDIKDNGALGTRNGDDGKPVQIITPSDVRNDKYYSYTIRGNHLLASSTTLGKVKLFKKENGLFVEKAAFRISNGYLYNYGQGIALLGNYVVISAPGKEEIYFYDINSYAKVHTLKSSDLMEAKTGLKSVIGSKLVSFSKTVNNVSKDYLLIVSKLSSKFVVDTFSLDASNAPVRVVSTAGDWSTNRDGEEVFSPIQADVIKADANYIFVASETGDGLAKVFSTSDWLAEKFDAKLQQEFGSGMRANDFTYDNTHFYVASQTDEGGEGKLYVSRIDGVSQTRKTIRPLSGLRSTTQEFGGSLEISGRRLYVGAPYYSEQGATLKGRLLYVDLDLP